MYCIGMCMLDDDGHFCVGCGRCFDNVCNECGKGIKYEPVKLPENTSAD